jgi:omega-6 fatty acid desaturase (delta-12 desaturase)
MTVTVTANATPKVTPLHVDARCTAGSTTLGGLRSALPPDALVVSPLRAWLGVVQAWCVIAVGEIALANLHVEPGARALWQVPAMVLAWLVVAAGMVGLFILGHDCGHEAFSKRRWVNYLVGHLCMAPILTGFHGWRLSHAHHHARPQLRGGDTDWPERMLTHDEYEAAPRLARLEAKAAFGSPVGLLFGFLVGMVRRTAMSRLYPQVKLDGRARRQLLISNLSVLLTSGGIATSLFWIFGASVLVKHYAIPLYLGMVCGALFTYLHHSGEGAVVFGAEGWTPLRGQVVSTFDVRFPPWFEALFFHINRHPPHHLSPRIPWYRLPRAMNALRIAHPEVHLERRFTLGYLWRAWQSPLLHETAPGVFVASARSTTDAACRR